MLFPHIAYLHNQPVKVVYIVAYIFPLWAALVAHDQLLWVQAVQIVETVKYILPHWTAVIFGCQNGCTCLASLDTDCADGKNWCTKLASLGTSLPDTASIRYRHLSPLGISCAMRWFNSPRCAKHGCCFLQYFNFFCVLLFILVWKSWVWRQLNMYMREKRLGCGEV